MTERRSDAQITTADLARHAGVSIATVIQVLSQTPIQPLRRALETCQVPLDQIPADAIGSTLHIVPEYVRRHGLPYGIAHEL